MLNIYLSNSFFFINFGKMEKMNYFNKYGFLRVSIASPRLEIANTEYNSEEILRLSAQAKLQGSSVIIFPELSITSYSCADLFFQNTLLNNAIKSLQKIIDYSLTNQILIIVGLPLKVDAKIYNVAAVIGSGELYGFVAKTFLPNYGEFYEKRWFASADELITKQIIFNGKEVPIGNDLIFQDPENPLVRIGVEICEDLWAVKPVSSELALAGANFIANLSASNELIGKKEYRENLVINQSARINGVYAYSSASMWESSTDLVYSGHCIIAENGIKLAESERFALESQLITTDCDIEKVENERNKNSTFQNFKIEKGHRIVSIHLPINNNIELKRFISSTPFVPTDEHSKNSIFQEIFNLQSTALARRLSHTKLNRLVIGISGGLDSTLALLVCVETLKKLKLTTKNILAVSMPGFGTTKRTKNNAKLLAEAFEVECREISIVDSTRSHFNDINYDENNITVTYENAQARRRTHILMDLANDNGGIVVGTGDLSEIALGWNTYNADHISMYNVNSSIPKTLVRNLIDWYANSKCEMEVRNILFDVMNTPISPELLPNIEGETINQETEKIIGSYVLHDFFLYHFVRNNFTTEKIKYLAMTAFKDKFDEDEITNTLEIFIKRFFNNQFKRSCFTDGVKVGSVSLSPRGDWRMPSDANYNEWI